MGDLKPVEVAVAWLRRLMFDQNQMRRLMRSAGDDPVGRLKVPLKKEPRCLNHMFTVEIFMERFLLPSAIQI